MKNRITMLLFRTVILSLFTAFTSFSGFGHSIEIDQSTRSLIAPAGSDFQWYKNGDVYMGGNAQTLQIKESGNYQVEFLDENGEQSIAEITVAASPTAIRTIHIIGDSTAKSYGGNDYPMCGWGQFLGSYLDPTKVVVSNHARGGRSSRSYYEDGNWASVYSQLKAGDFLFIQFGHNDSDNTNATRYTSVSLYKFFMENYVDSARMAGAVPVIVSPMVRNVWASTTQMRNVFTEGDGGYRGAALEVSQEKNVPFVDLNMRSFELVGSMDARWASKFLYMSLEAGEYPNYPSGSNDGGTHFQEMGAYAMASLVVDEIKGLTDDVNTKFIADALLPAYEVNVNMPNAQVGLVTPSSSKISVKYPVGAHITLKTTLDAGYKFIRWEDENNHEIGTDRRYEFDMEAKDYTFNAVVTDCQGIENGLGYFDVCGTCIDGTINKQGCVMTIEAEKACYFTGTKDTRQEEPFEVTYLTLEAGASDTIHYTVRAPKDSTYALGLKYTKGATGQIVDVYVNGKIAVEDMILIGAGSNWRIQDFDVDLDSANNFVSVVFPDVKELIEVDMLTAYVSGVQRGSNCKNIPALKKVILASPLSEGFSFYPNPFQTAATLKFPTVQHYQVISLSGIMLEEGDCQDCIIGERLMPGTYVLRIGKLDESQSFLIIKR